MKKLSIILLALMATCGSALIASADFRMKENFSPTVINVCHLADHQLMEIMRGNHPDIAVEFLAQTTLPIQFFIGGDFISLPDNEAAASAVEIKQAFYVRCVQQELIFSTNLTDWKPFLEFITGNASVSLIMQDGKPSILIGVGAYQRN